MSTTHTPSEQMPFIVCPACAGHGFRANPSLDGITSSQMDEWYGEDHDARETFVREYATRGGVYDVRCDECHGERVVRQECQCEGCEEARWLAWEDAEIQRQEIAFGC